MRSGSSCCSPPSSGSASCSSGSAPARTGSPTRCRAPSTSAARRPGTLDLEPREEDAEASAGRPGVARSRDRLRDEAERRGRDHGARPVHRAEAEEHRRALRAREPVHAAGAAVRDRLPERPAAGRERDARRPGVRPVRLDDRSGRSSQDCERAPGPDRGAVSVARVDAPEHRVHELPVRRRARPSRPTRSS